MTPKILLVDDDRYTVTLFENLFRGRAVTLEVAAAHSGDGGHWFR